MEPQNINRSSQDARQREPRNKTRSTPAKYSNQYQFLHTINALQEIQRYLRTLQKKKNFQVPDLKIDLTLRDIHISAINYSLINDERSQLVVNCLKGRD